MVRKDVLKIIIVLSSLITIIHARCSVTEEPKKIIDCSHYFTSALYGALVKDVNIICKVAVNITECIRNEIDGCIAAEVGKAALNEVKSLAENCCPDRNNIKCSIREDNLSTQRCFAADSLVTLTNGAQKPIIELQSGDQILAYNDKTNETVFTQVLTMLDHQPNQYATFKQLTTVSGRQLSLTSTHLLPTDIHGYVMAKNIRRGMNVYVIDNNGLLSTETISNVIDVVKQGYIAPLTKQGTLIVNNIAASCYATIDNHHLAHTALAPMRWWFSLFGQSEKITGIHWFPKMLYELTTFLVPSIIQN